MGCSPRTEINLVQVHEFHNEREKDEPALVNSASRAAPARAAPEASPNPRKPPMQPAPMNASGDGGARPFEGRRAMSRTTEELLRVGAASSQSCAVRYHTAVVRKSDTKEKQGVMAVSVEPCSGGWCGARWATRGPV
jgi:hypothetical protein